MFTECFSGRVVCLRTNQQKVNDPELLYNMRTFSNLVTATPYISHAYVRSVLLSSTYVPSAQGETLDCYTASCRVHYTTYTPLLPFAGPHHGRHRTSRATSWWKHARDADRAVILANIQHRKLLRLSNGETRFLGLFINCTCNSLIFSSEAD